MADRAQRKHLSVTPYLIGSRGTLCGRAVAATAVFAWADCEKSDGDVSGSPWCLHCLRLHDRIKRAARGDGRRKAATSRRRAEI